MPSSSNAKSLRARWLDVCLGVALLATLWNVSTVWLPSVRRVEGKEPLGPLINLGLPVPIPGLWANSKFERTAILMLDVNCPACLLSRPFYKELGGVVAQKRQSRFVVLTEDPIEVARKWLNEGDVQGRIVRIRSRKTLGFVGTPTLVLADAKGVVTDMVFGALGEAEGERFKARLRGDHDTEPLRLPYTITEVSAREHPEIGTRGVAQLIDTRDRTAFVGEHALSAVNIPRDELVARAPAELRKSLPVAVDCRYGEQAECRVIAAVLGDLGFATVIVVLR